MPKVDEHAVVPPVDAAARERLAAALDRDGVVAARLIGSQARGDGGPLSDVDVAVWLDPGLAPRARAALHDDLLAEAAAAARTGEIDVVILNAAPSLLQHRAMRDGLLLHERDKLSRVRLETAALLEYLDTAPLRETFTEARRRRLAEDRFGRR